MTILKIESRKLRALQCYQLTRRVLKVFAFIGLSLGARPVIFGEGRAVPVLCSSWMTLFGWSLSPHGAHKKWGRLQVGWGDLILQRQHQRIFINADGLSSHRSHGMSCKSFTVVSIQEPGYMLCTCFWLSLVKNQVASCASLLNLLHNQMLFYGDLLGVEDWVQCLYETISKTTIIAHRTLAEEIQWYMQGIWAYCQISF